MNEWWYSHTGKSTHIVTFNDRGRLEAASSKSGHSQNARTFMFKKILISVGKH